MATARDIVHRAYRKIGIVAKDEALEGEDSVYGLEALNGMLHEWKLRAVDITHTDLGMSDTFPLGPEYEDGTTYMLAARISSDYETPAHFDADDFFRAIQAAYMTISVVSLPRAVTEVPSKKERDGTLGYQWR